MRLRYSILIVLLCLSVALTATDKEDRFENIKRSLTSAKQVKLEVAVAVTSKIFNDVDSSRGQVFIADDGRYFAHLGQDIYIFDGKCIWEISTEYHQATKKCLKDGEKFENRLVFLKNMNDYYNTVPVKRDLVYHLVRKDSEESPLPDSMTIFLDKSANRISRIDYYDLNDDLNRVYLLSEKSNAIIDDTLYRFKLPDSTEVITLP